MSMLEDFWLPSREGRGTDISTLPGGQNLGEIADIEYFQKKLYRSLNVPVSRLESTQALIWAVQVRLLEMNLNLLNSYKD